MPWWMPAAIGAVLVLIAAAWFVACIPSDRRRLAVAGVRVRAAQAAERKERVHA